MVVLGGVEVVYLLGVDDGNLGVGMWGGRKMDEVDICIGFGRPVLRVLQGFCAYELQNGKSHAVELN